MKTAVSLLFLIILIASSCESYRPADKKNTSQSDTSKFYQLHTFFKRQIENVNHSNFPVYQILTKNGKRDSVPLTKEQFATQAAIFLQRDISEPAVKILYKESVFNDLSTGSITLNYTPVDKTAVVQNIDILVDEQTSDVKRVFIRAAYTKGDTSVIEQCNWKAEKSFQINRTLSTKNGYNTTETNFVNWNDMP